MITNKFFLTFVGAFILAFLSGCVYAGNNGECFKNAAGGDMAFDNNKICDKDELILLYRESGGRDIFMQGDVYGVVLRVFSSGHTVLLHQIYTEKSRSPAYKEQFVAQEQLAPEKLSELKDRIKESGMLQWPDRIPQVSPLEVQFRTPAKFIRIDYQDKEKGVHQKVSISLGADHKHYPEGFFALWEYLDSIVSDLFGDS